MRQWKPIFLPGPHERALGFGWSFMKTGFLAAIIVALLASSAYFAYRWQKAEERLDATLAYTHSIMDSLAATVGFPDPPFQSSLRDSLYWRWVATTSQIQMRAAMQVIREKNRDRLTLLDGPELGELMKAGFSDPPEALRQSLVSRPELIPYPAVLGGTMSFGEIVLIPRSFAFASFDDGHIAGNMLLSFTVLPDSTVKWEPLWSRLE